jgi:hypothetical protein
MTDATRVAPLVLEGIFFCNGFRSRTKQHHNYERIFRITSYFTQTRSGRGTKTTSTRKLLPDKWTAKTRI